MNAKNRLARLATATGCVLWMGAAVAQGGPGGAGGGPSNGYGGAAEMPAPSRQNTPTTGGGPTTQTSRSTRDEASTDRATGSSSSATRDDASSHATAMSEGMTGTISKIDSDRNTIELQGDRKLHVDPSTEIRRDGQKASFSDLHEGDDVRASFQGDDRSMVKRIDVLSGSSSSTAPSSSSRSTSSSPSSSGSSSGSSSSSGR